MGNAILADGIMKLTIAFFFFHGWIIACGRGQNKGKVWGH
jgi:hypothetical protein